jgi:hypothetical protein
LAVWLLRNNSVVFFDRRYRPIARSSYADFPVYVNGEPAGSLAVGSPTVTPVDPGEWIFHTDKRWFYTDANPPHRNRQTRERLEKLIATIPALAAEIGRRNSKAKVFA